MDDSARRLPRPKGPAGHFQTITFKSNDFLRVVGNQFHFPDPEVAKYLIRYEVEVEWTEGTQLHRVAHTTFAFDWKTASVETSIGEALSAGESLDGTDGGRDEEGSDSSDDSRDSGSSDDRSRTPEQQNEVERLKEMFRDVGVDI